MGLFSLLDAMIRRPLAGLFQELGTPAEMRLAVTGASPHGDVFSRLFRLCLACESGDMPAIESHAGKLGLPLDAVSALNMDAITWSGNLCLESGVRH